MLLLALLCFLPAKAAPPKKLPLKSMTPIFDDSFKKKSFFELGIKQTQIGDGLQKQDAIVDLHADSSVLKGQVSEIERLSIINTMEYGVKTQFYVDFRRMEAKYAPALSRILNARLKEARRKALAAVAHDEPLMQKEQKELNALRPKTDFPSRKLAGNANKNERMALAAELEKAKKQAAEHAKIAANKMNQERVVALGTNSGKQMQMPGFPNLNLSFPQVNRDKFPALPETKTKAQITMPEPVTGKGAKPLKMPEKNVKANVLPPRASLETEIALAKKETDAALRNLGKELKAIMTQLRVSPKLRLPEGAAPKGSAPLSAGSQDALETINWDKWHKKFAELAQGPILNCVSEAGNPAGANTVEITVGANHRLNVRLLQASNPKFDQAILKAYKTLDSNPELQFPAGSKRNLLTFLIDNKHEGGLPASVKSQTSVGDREVFRVKH